ncbi:unnamed protein product [[Candida] boidinii]|nr:unnamed protein product [[Candida] boidinii]
MYRSAANGLDMSQLLTADEQIPLENKLLMGGKNQIPIPGLVLKPREYHRESAEAYYNILISDDNLGDGGSWFVDSDAAPLFQEVNTMRIYKRKDRINESLIGCSRLY